MFIFSAPVDEWDSQSELAFPDDGELENLIFIPQMNGFILYCKIPC